MGVVKGVEGAGEGVQRAGVVVEEQGRQLVLLQPREQGPVPVQD